MESRSHFVPVDFVVFGITIAISLAVGMYYACSGAKQQTTSEYLLGNRKMAAIPVAISLIVSFESSITLLGAPAEVYAYGFQIVLSNIGWCAANLIAAKVIVPLLHPLKLTSTYEYLEMRFNSFAVRILGTILGMLSFIVNMGIVLFGPAIALEAVSGFPLWWSLVSIATTAVIYTALGGFKAVVWTDVFQFSIMLMGYLAVLIKGTIIAGGVQRTWSIAADSGRLYFDTDPNPTVRHTVWNLLFATFFRTFGVIFNQSSIQRMSSTPTAKDAERVFLFTGPVSCITFSFALIEGIVAFAYYTSIGCDPLAAKTISNPNQIIPYMVMDVFNGLSGLPGLFMASLFSASLSTLSSGLSSLSALLLEDVVKQRYKSISERRATIIAKASVVFFGIAVFVVSVLISKFSGTLLQLTVTLVTSFTGPLTGLFLFGAFCPWGNSKGALVGAITATAFVLWLSIGQLLTEGAVKFVTLPLGPTNNCQSTMNSSNIIQSMSNDSLTVSYDVSTPKIYQMEM